jgi:hypothetical protein
MLEFHEGRPAPFASWPALQEELHVEMSVLFGMEVTPMGFAGIGLIGLFIGAVGFFVARAGPARRVERNGLPFPHHPEFREPKRPGREKRAHPRYETQPLKLRLTVANSGDELDGLVINQSLGGLCICVSQNMPKGTVLNLQGGEQPQNRIKLQVVIKNSRPHRGGWALGCQFV